MSDDPDITANMSHEQMLKALRRAEDAAFDNFGAAVKLHAQLERTTHERTQKATETNRAKGDTNEIKAKRMRQDGKSVAQIARDLELTQRWVSRLLARK